MNPTWDESMETGDPKIDEQHKDLLDLVDKLQTIEAHGGSSSDIYSALDGVMSFTVSHFMLEENLMGQVGYPPTPTQQMIRQHEEFKSYARLRVLEFRESESLSVVPLQSFLKEWLIDHEFGLDRQLVDWIKSK